MDNEVVVNERAIKVRGLTRKEMRELRQKGLPLGDIKMEKAEETMDEALGMVLSPEDNDFLDGQPWDRNKAVWQKIMDLTFGSVEETKNS